MKLRRIFEWAFLVYILIFAAWSIVVLIWG